ncbi:MAG: hypothetical protein Q7K43_05665 [Candidatus Woesearchaeota archaeon]|nr:hypothetical protein [Candidatus Woesearchaeota archaeon]
MPDLVQLIEEVETKYADLLAERSEIDTLYKQCVSLPLVITKIGAKLGGLVHDPLIAVAVKKAKRDALQRADGGQYFKVNFPPVPNKFGIYSVIISNLAGGNAKEKMPYEEFLKRYPALSTQLPRPERGKGCGIFYVLHPSRNTTVLTVDQAKALDRVVSKAELTARAIELTRTNKIGAQLRASKTLLINQLSEGNSKIKQYENDVAELVLQKSFLNRCAFAVGRSLEIAKKNYSINNRTSFHSLWLGSSPVFRVSGDSLEFLAVSRQDDPFKIYQLPCFLSAIELRLSQHFFGLAKGSFCDDSGYALAGKNNALAKDLFNRVERGIEVFPRSEELCTDDREVLGSGNPNIIDYRHWGQEYIHSLGPDGEFEGEVLGSGGAYKLFVFSRKGLVLVEFDQIDRATYVFNTNYADELRIRNRRSIIEEKPEGFIRRIIHDNQVSWKQKLSSILLV